MFHTPILLLIFNRPETTQKTFDEIRKQQPKYLFIAADGPRDNVASDIEKCKQCRNVIATIDWDCEVKTLFRDKNLGCGAGPADAITWFFKNVEQGIILEDDIFPDQSFFGFCERMLKCYRNDERVMHISGGYFLENFVESTTKEYYYYTRHIHVWGWASWRRAWNNYDYAMRDWPRLSSARSLRDYYGRNYLFWKDIFTGQKKNSRNDIWDYQWMLSIYKCNGIAINPTRNLTLNIGFNSDATHTTDGDSIYNKMKLSSINVMDIKKRYGCKTIDSEKDDLYYRYYLNFDAEFAAKRQQLIWKLKNYTGRLVRRLKKAFR
ncbi:MAG: hypothetical protein ACTHNW_15205 [Mucilaginibacter sp.]